MNNSTLLELSRKWERLALPPQVVNTSADAVEANARCRGIREAYHACARDLRSLIALIGGEDEQS